MKLGFIKVTLFFAIIGIFIPEITAFGIIKSQRIMSLFGIDCVNAWSVIWAMTGVAALSLPILFYRQIVKHPQEKYPRVFIKLTLFNIFEYTLIQTSLMPLFTNGKTLCYITDGQNGLELVYTAWLSLPILIGLSIFFNQKLKEVKAKIRIPKVSYFIISILILFYLFTVYTRYITNPWNSQQFANYFESDKTTESKLLEGNKNCDCISLDIKIDNRTLEAHDSIVNVILTDGVKTKRFLHYIIGSYDPYRLQENLLPKLDYDPASIIVDGIVYNSKLKLTGGQADHYLTEKRSLRIKVKDTTLLGLKKFNIYNPISRLGGLYEWFNIELMKSEGLIGLETGYVNVSINDKEKGVYFYQEQPSIQTLINNNKSPGIIVRIKHSIDNKGNKRMQVENYYDEKSLPSKEFFEEQNRVLERKISDYAKGKIGIEELVSMPKMAKYLALIDLSNAYHGSQLRNIYFYLSPSDSLLEPIGREFATNFYQSSGSYIYNPFELKTFNKEESVHMQKIFKTSSSEFEKYYNSFIKEVSNTEFLTSYFEEFNTEIFDRQACLYKADPSLKSFSKDQYFNNQVLIREYLNGK